MAEEMARILGGLAILLLIGTLAFKVMRGRTSGPVPAPDVARGLVLVMGWRDDELRTILRAFTQSYGLAESTIRRDGEAGEWKRLRIARFGSDHLFFLVNYLHYPREYDPAGRKIEAAALFDLPDGIGPAGATAGTRAKAYVPVQDDEFDVAHAALPDGRAFRVPFTNLRWQAVSDPRMSDRVAAIPFTGDLA